VISFFSSPNHHPLYGYKLSQYTLWLTALKNSSRYSQIGTYIIILMVSTLRINLIKTMNNIGCLKCWVISFLIISFSVWQFINCCQSIETSLLILPLYSTFSNKIKGYKRIGPHSRDIISIIFGSLLGFGDVERKKDGTRITFFKEAMHVKYLL